MGCKRQRSGVSSKRLSLIVAALAWVATATVAAHVVQVADQRRIRTTANENVERPTRLRWRRILVEEAGVAGTVHAENAMAMARQENREGSSSGGPPAPTSVVPTPTPSSAAPTPSSPPPAPSSSRPPPSSSSSRGDESVPPAPAPSATTVAPPAPTTAPPPPPPPATEAATQPPATQPPAPSSPPPPPPPTETTPIPTTHKPESPSPPPPSPPPEPSSPVPPPPPPPASSAPPPPPPPPPPPSSPPSPPASTPAPPAATTANPPPAPAPGTPPPPAPTTPSSKPPPAPSSPAPSSPAPSSPAPLPPPTKAPATTTATPRLTTSAPSPTPSQSADAGTGAGSREVGSESKAEGNEKAKAPDLSTLTPITGGDMVITPKQPGAGDGSQASATTKNKAQSAGLNKISTLGIAGIVAGVLAVVMLAILFVHARRRRQDTTHEVDSTRQRELDHFFTQQNAPIPRSGHPGAASVLETNNGLTFLAPPSSLTPPDEIPIASSGRFKPAGTSGQPMSPGGRHPPGGRFNDDVLNQGRIVPKGRMYSIPASPDHAHHHGDSSDFEQARDSLMGSGGASQDTSRRTSEQSGLSSMRSFSDASRRTSSGASTYLPPAPLPRTHTQDDASTTYSVSDSEYSPGAHAREGRLDSTVSSASNPNPWAMLTLDDALARSVSPPTSVDESVDSRADSQVSSLFSDQPTSGRSDASFLLSDDDDDGGDSTRSADSAFDVDSYAGGGSGSFSSGAARSDRTDSYGFAAGSQTESFTDGDDDRSARSDSYGYVDSSFSSDAGSQLSFVSDGRDTAFLTQSGGPDVLEGNI